MITRQTMVGLSFSPPAEYWQEIQISKQDIELLHAYLFENETPMSVGELMRVFIEERLRIEKEAVTKKRQTGGKVFYPKDHFKSGDKITFPGMEWQSGEVKSIRPGINPQYGDFEVITVELDSGEQRLFAAGLAQHAMNDQPLPGVDDASLDVNETLQNYGSVMEEKLDAAFQSDADFVRIAGKWFPRALLVDVNQGHLNLAEAVLDMSSGEPLPTSELLKDVELPEGVNPKLAEFSLNLALQEDERFDEVGPAGKVLWCLKRLEPDNVKEVPIFLRYSPLEYDRSLLTQEMLALESQLDDEFSEETVKPEQDLDEVTVSLVFPHWRAGTLPVTPRIRSMFPTAYESPRVRFTFVDGISGEKMPAWVVREHRYVSGLRDWYETQELIPGSLIRLQRGENPGEVIIKAKTHRTMKDWVRTVIVGTDGGVVFALLKQTITAEINDRMAFAISAVEAIDEIWNLQPKQRKSFERVIEQIMRELTKLNPQSHIHAQDLYSAVNIVQRVPFGPMMALLAGNPDKFVHVGDLHYRLGDQVRED
jgi:hypothetical protein